MLEEEEVEEWASVSGKDDRVVSCSMALIVGQVLAQTEEGGGGRVRAAVAAAASRKRL